MKLGFDSITKKFAERKIAEDLTLLFESGRVICLMGPSGCGKTTLLNMFAGLITPDSGRIVGIENQTFSYIFQEPRLLPFMNVRENIALVMTEPDEDYVETLITLVDLDGNEEKYPSELSGGMQQRVSFARALANKPTVILADEPGSSLDIPIRKMLYYVLQLYAKEHGTTVLMVTHDPKDCVDYADDIYVLSGSPIRIIYQATIDQSVTNNSKEKRVIYKKLISLLREEEGFAR